MSLSPASVDDEDEGGDLGLGLGLRPGAIPNSEHSNYDTELSLLTCPVSSCDVSAAEIDQNDVTNREWPPVECRCCSGSNTVAIGTSIRQQRCVFQQELNQIIERNCHCEPHLESPTKGSHTKDQTSENPTRQDNGKLERNLRKTQQEMWDLKSELHLCQKQLIDKYKGVQLMHGQAVAVHNEQQKKSQKAKHVNKKLQKEINQLEFGLKHLESTMIDSERKWASRFDGVSLENSALLTSLEEKSELIGQLRRTNEALRRERDEMLSLMDLKEQHRLESLGITDSDSLDTALSDIEIAVLGMCPCCPPGYCSCATAACRLQKRLINSQDKLSLLERQHVERVATVSAYRNAFEEQLERNESLVRELAQLATPGGWRDETTTSTTRGSVGTAKAAVRFLLQSLSEAHPQGHSSHQEFDRRPDEPLIRALVDVINEKSSALAHQRLAMKLLTATLQTEARPLLPATMTQGTQCGNFEEVDC